MASGSVKSRHSSKVIASGTHSSTGIEYNITANGECCCCTFVRESNGTAASGWTQIATVPDGYRPSAMIVSYFINGNANATIRFRVRTGGEMEIYSPPTGQLAGSITYPI